MFDPKVPIHMSIMVLLISFICTVGILYLINPICIQTNNENTGKSEISWKLTITYSFTLSLLFSISTLLYLSERNNGIINSGYDIKLSFPDSSIASAFCGR